MPGSLTSNEIEAANRAEVTAILIRAGYRVYGQKPTYLARTS